MTPDVMRWPGPAVAPNRRTAFIVPGSGYSAVEPLLYWSSCALVQAGFEVISIAWPTERDIALDGVELVRDGLNRAETFSGTQPDLVVAMSLGCLSVELLPDTPHVLLSPIIVPGYSASLGNGMLSKENCVAIGGGKDPLWSADLALSRGFEVVEITGANHSLELGGSWQESLRALSQVIHHVARYGRTIAGDATAGPQ